MTHRAIIWSSAALLGIVLTAALAWAASQLAGQRIALSSEPLSALGSLAPPPATGYTSSTAAGAPRPAQPRGSATHPGPAMHPRPAPAPPTVTASAPASPPLA